MKKWAWMVTLLYVMLLVLFTVPVIAAAFFPDFDSAEDVWRLTGETAGAWGYWVGVAGLLLAQHLLLLVPVELTGARPAGRRLLLFPVITGAVLFGVLVSGMGLCIYETATRKGVPDPAWGVPMLALFLGSWIIWAVVFRRWSREMEPRTFVDRQCRALFYGSVLQLLVAVPTHVVARSRNYCCAGFSTFMGLTFGIAIMLLSFGPAVYYLFVARWRRVQGAGQRTETP